MCDYFDNEADATTKTTRKAAKRHRCDECGLAIVPGTVYVRMSWLYDGRWLVTPVHPDCLALHADIGERLCGGRYALGGTRLRDVVLEHLEDDPSLRWRWRDLLRTRQAEGAWPRAAGEVPHG